MNSTNYEQRIRELESRIHFLETEIIKKASIISYELEKFSPYEEKVFIANSLTCRIMWKIRNILIKIPGIKLSYRIIKFILHKK